MSTALVTHRDCVKHEISAGHPECPQRIDAINDQLMKQDIFDHLRHLDAPLASREALMLAHPEAYVDMIHAKAPASGSVQLDADTAMNPYSLDASLRAAGAGVLATDRVCNGEISNAFCLTRPPGHHAERAQAMGFCFFGPLASGSNSADFRHAITQQWLPALEQYKPQMIFVSAGFDAHTEDPLANISLIDDDYIWITQQIMDIADRHADGRIVSMLEGGYALPALSRCATAHVRGLMGL